MKSFKKKGEFFIQEIKKFLDEGVDKIIINSFAVENPNFIKD